MAGARPGRIPRPDERDHSIRLPERELPPGVVGIGRTRHHDSLVTVLELVEEPRRALGPLHREAVYARDPLPAPEIGDDAVDDRGQRDVLRQGDDRECRAPVRGRRLARAARGELPPELARERDGERRLLSQQAVELVAVELEELGVP